MPWPCARSRADERHRHRDRAGEVGLHDLERGRGVVLGPLLVAEHAERDEHEVEVAEAIEGRVARTLSCDAKSVASNATACTSDAPAARSSRPRASHASGLRAASTTRAPRRATSLRARRERDVGGAAEHEHRLHLAQRVLHRRPPAWRVPSACVLLAAAAPLRSSRRSMSLRSRFVGSSAARAARHSSRRGYIAARSSGRSRESLVRYTRPPASTTSSSSPSSNGVERRRRGDVERERPARDREPDQRTAVVLEPLEHGEERRDPGRAEALERRRARPVPRRTARRTGTARSRASRRRGSSPRTPSSGKKNGLMPSTWRRGVRGALRNHISLNARTLSEVDQPVRQPRRRAEQRAGRVLARARPFGGGQVVERRVVAARQHRPAEVAAAREAVDPRDGVAVVVVAVEHPGHAVVDVVRCARCRTRCATSRPAAAAAWPR